MCKLKWILIATLAAATLPLLAADADDVRKVLITQQQLWNTGDLKTFTDYYTDDCVFVGKTVERGRVQVLERYRRSYPNRDAMGTLTFSEIEVRMLGAGHASVLGRFHLARGEKGGGDASGRFTLLLERTKQGWQIILDHTS